MGRQYRSSQLGFHAQTPADDTVRLKNLRALIHSVHLHKPSLIHSSIDTGDLAQLQTDPSPTVATDAHQKIQKFLLSLLDQPFDSYGPCAVPSSAALFIQYLATSSFEQVLLVMTQVKEELESLLDDEPQADDFPNRSLPLIAFTTHLVYYSPHAALLASGSGLVDLILSTETEKMSPTDMLRHRTRQLLLLGALVHHSSYHATMIAHFEAKYKTLAIYIQNNIPYILSVQLCLQVSDSTFIDLAPEIASLVPAFLSSSPRPIPNDPRLSNPWSQLIACFDPSFEKMHDSDLSTVLTIRQQAAEQLLLLAASTPESGWESLTDTLLRRPTGMTDMFSYLIDTYLGCPSDPAARITLSTNNLDFLQRISSLASDFAVVHPVDRWIMLTARATRNHRKAVAAIGMDRMTRLLEEVERGSYDLIVKPTKGQLGARTKECKWMRLLIKNLEDDSDEE